MQKLSSRHLSQAQKYLLPEPEFNLFAIGDLERFGMEGDHVSTYTADDWREGMGFPYFLLDYRGNFLVYSHDLNYDGKAVGEFLAGKNPRNISGADSVIRKLLPYLPGREPVSTYLARLNQVTEEQRRRAGKLMGQVRRLTEEDIPAIYRLYLKIEEFSANYQNRSEKECHEDIRMNVSKLGRSYGIFEGERLVSVAQTSAENQVSAMVIGVATHSEFRRKGYARAVVLALCQDCLAEGKKFLCLFYHNPAAGKIYHSIGFQDVGTYTMLQNSGK